jgi:hypothetical protein
MQIVFNSCSDTDHGVCQTYGEDLLYRHIHLRKPHRLLQLAERVVLAAVEGVNLLEKTESLQLSFRGLNISYVDALLCVLRHTTMLSRFHADDPIMPSILLAMPNAAVTNLSVVVGPPSGASCALLQLFKNLTSLRYPSIISYSPP